MEYLESIASRVQLLLESSEVREHFENAVHDYVESLTKPDTGEHSEHPGDMYSGEPSRHLIPRLSNVDSQDKKAVVLFAVWCFVNEKEWNKPPLLELRFTKRNRDARYVGEKPDLVHHFQYEVWKHQVSEIEKIDSKRQALFQYIVDVEDHFGIHVPKAPSSKADTKATNEPKGIIFSADGSSVLWDNGKEYLFGGTTQKECVQIMYAALQSGATKLNQVHILLEVGSNMNEPRLRPIFQAGKTMHPFWDEVIDTDGSGNYWLVRGGKSQ